MKSLLWPNWSSLEPLSPRVAETGPRRSGSDGSRRRTPRLFFWELFLVFFLLDQATKRWILGHGGDLPIPLIPGLLSLVSVRNTGIVFGLFSGLNWLWIAAGVIFLFTGFWIGRKVDWGPWSTNGIAALLASGAAGNITDRVLHGFVVDFIDVYVGPWHWPSFNVADSSLSLASLWMIFRFGLVSRR